MHIDAIHDVIALGNQRKNILARINDVSCENCRVSIGLFNYHDDIATVVRYWVLEALHAQLAGVEGELLQLGVVCHKLSGGKAEILLVDEPHQKC